MKCALVGCGYWGEKVLDTLRTRQASKPCGLPHGASQELLAPFSDVGLKPADFELKGVYDSNPAHTLKTQKAHIYPSYEAVLQDSEIEAVFLITPPASHFHLAKAGLQAKKHIFVEKPLSLSSGECDVLYTLAHRHQVILHCDHIFLYAPAVQWLRSHIQDFGELLSIQARRMSFGRFQKEVDVVWDLALHDIAILDYVLGGITLADLCKPYLRLSDVAGYRAVADTALVYRQTSVSIHTSWLSPTKVRELAIIGSKYGCVYDEVAESKLTLFAMDSTPTILESTTTSPYDQRIYQPYQQSTCEYLANHTPIHTMPQIDLTDTPPLLSSIAHFYAQILSKQPCMELIAHTQRVVRILEYLDEVADRGGGAK